MPTEYLRILYLLVSNPEFDENTKTCITLISRKTANYMGYILTWILWKYSYTIKSASLFDSVKRIHSFRKIQENTFISSKELENMYQINARIYRIMRGFTALARIWRLKHAKIYNNEDLYMNPIYAGDKNTIILLKNNMKYVFTLKELIGNFNRELSNTCNLFIQPLPCKNPYTNECFTKSDLYNIYFAVRASTFIMPRLLHEYFLADFCLADYMNENEHMIREYYIDKYVNRITHDILLESVHDMFSEHKIYNMKIHKDFPKLVLKELMTPYLKLHYTNKMTSNKWKKAHTFMKLHKMLHNLKYESPSFGRKKYMKTMVENKPKYLKHYFETKLPKMNTVPLDKFMKSNLALNITEDSHTMFNYDLYLSQTREEILRRQMPPRFEYDELNTTLHNMEELHLHVNDDEENEENDTDDDDDDENNTDDDDDENNTDDDDDDEEENNTDDDEDDM